MPILGLNIDHVATLRQARRTYEPDPAWAAAQAQLAGAACLTIHLREDRRHIQDHDLTRVKALCQVKLNLEMAATAAMVDLACREKPQMCTLVPEGRQEVTTEGGLDVAGQLPALQAVVRRLHDAGILASAFIDAQPRQIAAASQAGFDYCEIHTGPYAQLFYEARGDVLGQAWQAELARVENAGNLIQEHKMQFNAGHALNYLNVGPIAALAGIRELHIGHAIISRALFVGLRQATEEMVRLLEQPRAAGGGS